jgi:GT2 family glycosyltransferase
MAAERDGPATAPAAQWLGFDGRVLRWRCAAPAPFALCIDRVVFQRFPAPADTSFALAFDYSPTGHAELEFALDAGGAAPWRVRHGRAADAGIDQWTHAAQGLAPLAGTPLLPAHGWTQLPPVAIVVPIYNAAASVRRCLAALARWTPAWAQWILVDDASSDPAIAEVLAGYAPRSNVRIERHGANRGYTTAVNTGIAAAGAADVVLLNSDTEVGPRWLESLRLAAHGDARIGTVTAVSDNAGAFSVPELEQYCPIPPRWSLVEAQRAVLQQAGLRLPELPTGNGFCMFVKRALIERVGVMDATAFPAGYGEENDFCQRAIAAGYRSVIAGHVLVRHERSASFGDARRAALGAHGMAVLRQRYPRYEADIGATLRGFDRCVLDYRVRRTYAGADPDYAQASPRPRVLLAEAPRGADAPANAYCEVFVLDDDEGFLRLRRVAVEGALVDVARAEAADPAGVTLRRWLLAHAIEGVQPAAGGALGARLREHAAGLGIPAAMPSPNGFADG